MPGMSTYTFSTIRRVMEFLYAEATPHSPSQS